MIFFLFATEHDLCFKTSNFSQGDSEVVINAKSIIPSLSYGLFDSLVWILLFIHFKSVGSKNWLKPTPCLFSFAFPQLWGLALKSPTNIIRYKV